MPGIAKQLIVAADFPLNKSAPQDMFRSLSVQHQRLMKLAEALQHTGVMIKGHVSFLPNCSERISYLNSQGFACFADFKSDDIPRTMRSYAYILRSLNVEMATVYCQVGVKALQAFKEVAGDMQVLGFAFPSSFSEEEVKENYHVSSLEAYESSLRRAQAAGLDGMITPAWVLRNHWLQEHLGSMLRVAVGVRRDSDKNGEHAEIITPREAIMLGATHLVVGSPIVNALQPRTEALMFIDEIRQALVARERKRE